jgi:hypothetical protein
MDQKYIKLAKLYGIEIKDTPGSVIIENGIERPITDENIDKIFGLEAIKCYEKKF